jgi:hypothetical protein
MRDKEDIQEKTFSPYLYGALEIYDKNPSSRFISDGLPDTVTIPANHAGELRSDLPKSLKINLR